MIPASTCPGTKVICIDTRGCYSRCQCGGNHGLGPLREGNVYIVASVRGGGSGQPDAGYTVHLEEIFRDDLMGNDVGYAPQRFRVLEERRSRTSAPERVPIVRVRELEDA